MLIKGDTLVVEEDQRLINVRDEDDGRKIAELPNLYIKNFASIDLYPPFQHYFLKNFFVRSIFKGQAFSASVSTTINAIEARNKLSYSA